MSLTFWPQQVINPLEKQRLARWGANPRPSIPSFNGSDRPNGHGSAVRPRIDYSEGVRLSSELRDPGCYFNETHVLGGEKKNNFLVRCVWFSAFRSAPSHLPSISVAWATIRIERLDSGARRPRIVSEVSSRARALFFGYGFRAVRCSLSWASSWWVESLGGGVRVVLVRLWFGCTQEIPFGIVSCRQRRSRCPPPAASGVLCGDGSPVIRSRAAFLARSLVLLSDGCCVVLK
jgi:hypothetical protein